MSDSTYKPVTAANAPKINTPGGGYKTESLLTNIVKTKAQEYVVKKGSALASRKLGEFAEDAVAGASGKLMSKFSSSGGLMNTAQNKAVMGARSATQKFEAALGGKAASLLGGKLGGIAGRAANQLASQATGAITKQVSNLATGAMSKVSAGVSAAGNAIKGKVSSALGATLGSAGSGLLGNQVSKLSDSAAKNLVGASFAPGMLETGPKQGSQAVDIYGTSDNSILNDIANAGKNALSSALSNAVDDVRAVGTDAMSAINSIRLRDLRDPSDLKDRLTQRIIGSVGGRSAMVTNLNSRLQSNVINGNGLPTESYSQYVSQIGDLTQVIDAEDVENARDVYRLINQISKASDNIEFVDVGAQSALLAGVMREAIMLGDSKAIEVLLENSNDEATYNALYANIQVALEYSDIDTLLEMIAIIGVDRILSLFPEAPQMLLANYRLPKSTTSEAYDDELTGLVAALDSLKPTWGKSLRNGTWVNDLRFYNTISEDARKLLVRSEDHMLATLVGSAFPSAPDLREEFKRMYPYTPI